LAASGGGYRIVLRAGRTRLHAAPLHRCSGAVPPVGRLRQGLSIQVPTGPTGRDSTPSFDRDASTLFTAAAALEEGYAPPSFPITTGDSYTSPLYRDGSGRYEVSNAGSHPATLDLEGALIRSSNTYFLALEDELGSVRGPVRKAERMGMNFDRPNQSPAQRIIDENRGSFTFGAEATSPLDLASAYSTLAAGGTRCDPTPVTAITDADGAPTRPDGSTIDPTPDCADGAVSSSVADTLNQILRRDVEPGYPGQTGARAYVPGHQLAGKTGTSQDNYSATFVGCTPEYSASVMVLNATENENVGSFGDGRPAIISNDAMTPI
jgi:membrane peptidoglycan carboxypeptidase